MHLSTARYTDAMPKALDPGEAGKVTLLHSSKWKGTSASAQMRAEWAASCRYRDHQRGVIQIRRFGDTKNEALDRLEAAIEERRHWAEAEASPLAARSFGEALDWWWATMRPRQGWSAGTERTMGFAMKRLEPFRDSPWPLHNLEEAMAKQLGDSRTAALARRLLSQIVRDASGAGDFELF